MQTTVVAGEVDRRMEAARVLLGQANSHALHQQRLRRVDDVRAPLLALVFVVVLSFFLNFAVTDTLQHPYFVDSVVKPELDDFVRVLTAERCVAVRCGEGLLRLRPRCFASARRPGRRRRRRTGRSRSEPAFAACGEASSLPSGGSGGGGIPSP